MENTYLKNRDEETDRRSLAILTDRSFKFVEFLKNFNGTKQR